jgi:hypothetical protein
MLGCVVQDVEHAVERAIEAAVRAAGHDGSTHRELAEFRGRLEALIRKLTRVQGDLALVAKRALG